MGSRLSAAYVAGILLGAMSVGFAASSPCSKLEGSVYVTEKCLKFFDLMMTWFEAQDFCSTHLHGGTLLEPLTSEERNTSVNLAISLQQTFWLGAAYIATAGTFKFTRSNVSLLTNDTWWAIGEPDLSGIIEDCLHLGVDFLTIVDISCWTLGKPICQTDVTPEEPPSDPCAPWKGATYRNGKCFKTFNVSRSWQDAQTFCPAAMSGAKLVEFLTDDERSNILFDISDSGFQKTWVGGIDVSLNGIFAWATHQNVAIDRNIWTYNVAPGGDCVFMVSEIGQFDTMDCTTYLPYLCETALTTACDIISSVAINQKCIQLYSTAQTWDDAQTFCVKYGGTLAELTSLAERIAVSQKFNTTFYWVGATDSSNNGTYFWTNRQTAIRLNWWQAGQPDGVNESCVALDLTLGTLSDENCMNGLPFICQADAADPCEGILPGSVYSSGYCIKYYGLQLTWPEAQSYCLHNHSHLAEPKTVDMQRVLQEHWGQIKSAWLGANNAITKINFTWVTSGEQVVSTYLNLSDTSGQDDCLLWNNTADGVLWQDRPWAERRGFFCQTAVVVIDPQRHVAVVPKMVRNGVSDAHLQITASFRYIEVYLAFRVSYDKGVEEEKLMVLTPKRAVQFNLSSSLTLSETNVYSRFVEVASSMPVAVVLYIMDRTLNLASSCLIFPAEMFASKQTGRSYILHLGIPYRKDTTVTIVAMSSGTTEVMITYNNHGHPASSFSIGDVIINKLYTAIATLRYMNDAMALTIGANLDGAYINASQPVAVFLENLGNKSSSWNYDFSMDQLLPLEYLGAEYITLSQPAIDFSKDVYRFVAAEDSTFVEILYSGKSVRNATLKSIGDNALLEISSGLFYQMQGNASFYVYKVHDRSKINCMSALLPTSAWRYQYDFEYNSAYKVYSVYLIVVVWSNMTAYFEVNYSVPKTNTIVKAIAGSPYSGITYAVLITSSDRYYHLQFTNQRTKFGAYLFAQNINSCFCHPLGIASKLDVPVDIPSFDLYQASLLQEDLPQTTCGIEGTTVESRLDTTEAVSRTATSSSRDMTLDALYAAVTTGRYESTEDTARVEMTQGSDDQHTDVTNGDTTSVINTTAWSSVVTDMGKLTSNIIRHLCIEAQNTSAYRRSMTSAPDYRFSARMIGGVGVAVLLSVFTIISLGDSSHIYKLYTFLRGKLLSPSENTAYTNH